MLAHQLNMIFTRVTLPAHANNNYNHKNWDFSPSHMLNFLIFLKQVAFKSKAP